MTDLMDEINKMEDKDLILDRMKSMTISEIAKKHGYNRETARRKIKKMSELLRKKVLKQVYNTVGKIRMLPEQELFNRLRCIF